MYGMIHRGIREMIVEADGQAKWDVIEREAGIGPTAMISGLANPDEVTFRMVTAAAGHMGMTLPECLEAFGRYWIRYAERGSFAAVMDFTGHDIATFIGNLDRMHQTITAVMPDTIMPRFRLAGAEAGRLIVEYSSHREGLEPFVRGLLLGLLERFDLEGTVRQTEGRTDPSEFVIQYAV